VYRAQEQGPRAQEKESKSNDLGCMAVKGPIRRDCEVEKVDQVELVE